MLRTRRTPEQGPAEHARRTGRAPAVGLRTGGAVIALATGASVYAVRDHLAWAAAFLAVGLAFLAPAVRRRPVTRRRCVWTAVGWFVGGALLAPLAWVGCIVPVAAVVAAVPALVAAGVGWD